jgi:hypothetical protein
MLFMKTLIALIFVGIVSAQAPIAPHHPPIQPVQSDTHNVVVASPSGGNPAVLRAAMPFNPSMSAIHTATLPRKRFLGIIPHGAKPVVTVSCDGTNQHCRVSRVPDIGEKDVVVFSMAAVGQNAVSPAVVSGQTPITSITLNGKTVFKTAY